MYGLHYRESLPQVVADELDGLVAALRGVFYKEHNEDGTHVDAAPEFALVPVGSMQAWPTSTPPERWLLCDGSAISRITYRSLFTVIGITYGAGDSVLTFNLPQLQGRFPLGKAASGTGSTLGAVGGSIDHTHQGPSHTHSISSGGAHTHTTVAGTSGSESAHTHSFSDTSGTGSTSTNVDANGVGTQYTATGQGHTHDVSGTTGAGSSHTHSVAAAATDSQGSHDHGGATGSAGTGATGASNPPFLVINWVMFAGGTV